jgi:tetratricopeptide (TPR) repeat protein
LENTGLQLIVATWLAVIQNNTNKKYVLNINRIFIFKTMRWFPTVIWVAVFIPGCFIRRDIKYNEKCMQAIETKDLKSAEYFINHTSKTAPYLVNRSSVYLKQFQQTGNGFYLNLAEENLKQAIKKNPKDFQLQYNLAIVLNKKGNIDESFDILNKLTNHFPKNPLYHAGLSQLFCSKQNMQKATDHLVQAILLSPELLNSQIYTNSINNNERLDSMIHTRLKYEINRKNNVQNDPLQLARHARILLHSGDTLLSQSYLEYVTGQMPNLPRPWCYLGIIAFENKDSLNGRKYLKASLSIDPTDRTARDCWEKYTGELLHPIYPNKESSLDFLQTVYYTKFQKWYRTLPVRTDINL